MGSVEVKWHKAKCCNARRTAQCFKLRTLRDLQIEFFSQRDIIRDHLRVFLTPGLLKCKPDFQRADSTWILRPHVEVIDGLRPEKIVGRMIDKCIAQVFRPAHTMRSVDPIHSAAVFKS